MRDMIITMSVALVSALLFVWGIITVTDGQVEKQTAKTRAARWTNVGFCKGMDTQKDVVACLVKFYMEDNHGR
jgi:hypothetical protein